MTIAVIRSFLVGTASAFRRSGSVMTRTIVKIIPMKPLVVTSLIIPITLLVSPTSATVGLGIAVIRHFGGGVTGVGLHGVV